MNNEIEAKFLNINKDEIRKKLKDVGAKLVRPEVLMRRRIFDIGNHSYARVRDEGYGNIVMTYKKVDDDNSIFGTKEINLKIDDFDNGVLFLKCCGLEIKAEQETYRETWMLDDTEICIDTWPWIPTFIEIEGPTEAAVWSVAEKLGFEKADAKFGAVDTTYQHYYGVDPDIVNLHTPKILFDMELPEWAKKGKN